MFSFHMFKIGLKAHVLLNHHTSNDVTFLVSYIIKLKEHKQFIKQIARIILLEDTQQ